MNRKSIATFFLFAALNVAGNAAQPNLDESIADLGHRWAKVSYQTPDSEKEAAFRTLIANTQQVSQSFPDRAEPLIWQAIVLASAAKAEGGLGALGKAKEARDFLLAAEKINPNALDGSVYNSLGSLYAKVPGWPIGFGDKKKARDYFEKALAINPNGIDPNYFYADLLADQGEYAKAAEHLKRALAAPARSGREDADSGRRQEAMQLLESIKQKHGEQLASK
ncbi:MAG: tetratricopeptide repeat protein [Propionivibrio sp.]|uniref:Tetratricopeptide repeat protein n=1 Tax=Candidatus Propionivibrio dominans TaxID=2954373 RepID=A0A9D7I8A6_9RHOO|nr:tetratricopeptide repeat protein [Candidatus Propionivibrio dominans]MBL0167143.1 tetratricopeptide repeat protein [Propionivibrio sp.]